MTIDKFEEVLQKELAWRKKEVSELLLYSKEKKQEVLLKSLILLIYSHWEGFIKKSSKLYLKYVSEANVELKQLTTNFKVLKVKDQIKYCFDSKDSISFKNEMKFIDKYAQESIFKLKIKIDNDRDNKYIDTKSNLNPDVYKNILNVLGLVYKDSFQLKEEYLHKHFIDVRNSIGHGSPFNPHLYDDFSLEIPDVEKLKDIIFRTIDLFVDELVYYAEKEYYLEANKEEKEQYDARQEEILAKIYEEIRIKYDN